MSSENNQSNYTALNVFVSILTLVLVLLTAFGDGPFSFTDNAIYQMIYVAITAISLTLIVNWTFVNRWINKQVYKIKMLNSIIFEYRNGHLKFAQPFGEDVIYVEDCLIKRIKRRFIYEGFVGVEGEISDDIQTFNCYNSLNNKKNKVTIIYGRKRKKESESLINKRQLQFGYVIKMKNSFLAEEESWTYRFAHYTKIYNLKMSFNKKNPPEYVDILQAKLDSNGFPLLDSDGNEVFQSLPTDPLIIKNGDKIMVKIVLLHLDKGSKFKIIWKWKQKKPK